MYPRRAKIPSAESRKKKEQNGESYHFVALWNEHNVLPE